MIGNVDWVARLAEVEAQEAAAKGGTPKPKQEPKPEPKPGSMIGDVDWVARLAESDKKIADEKARKEQMAQRAFEAKEAEKGWLERKGDEVLRGVFRGGEKLAVGAADLVGLMDKSEYESKVPHSSGSTLESASEWLTPIPGLGVAGKAVTMLPKVGSKLAANTAGNAAARGAAHAGAYGALTSDEEGMGRIADAGNAAISGALLGAGLHSATRGVAKVSDEAKKLVKDLDTTLGDKRIGGSLTLGKSVGNDIGSRLTRSVAAKVNRGKRAHTVRDRNQRVMDDVMGAEIKKAYKDIPAAAEAGLNKLHATRNFKKSLKAAEKVANKAETSGTKTYIGSIDDWHKAKAESADFMGQAKLAQQEQISAAIQRGKETRLTKVAALEAQRKARAKAEEIKRGSPEWADLMLDHRKKVAALRKAETDSVNQVRLKQSMKANKIKEQERQRLKALRPESQRNFHNPTAEERLAREMLSDTVKQVRDGTGRFSPGNAEKAGNLKLADDIGLMQYMDFTPVPKVDKYKKASPLEMGMNMAGLVSGNPALAAASATTSATRALKKARNVYQKRRLAKDEVNKGRFQPNAAELSPLPNDPRIVKYITGDSRLQKRYQELVAAGDGKALEEFLQGVAIRAAAGDNDAA